MDISMTRSGQDGGVVGLSGVSGGPVGVQQAEAGGTGKWIGAGRAMRSCQRGGLPRLQSPGRQRCWLLVLRALRWHSCWMLPVGVDGCSHYLRAWTFTPPTLGNLLTAPLTNLGQPSDVSWHVFEALLALLLDSAASCGSLHFMTW